jgi:type 2 lantibiotic biosynthesis protein LanM
LELIEEIILSSKPVLSVPEEIGNIPFGDGFWPWMEIARKQLKKKTPEQLTLLSSNAIFSLEKGLVERWSKFLSPSLSLEMAIARMGERLEGKTSRTRYFDFISKTFWNEQNLRAFFNEYAELIHYVTTLLSQWVEQVSEFLVRLEKDLPILETFFNKRKSLGIVSMLSPNKGDAHNHGRTVYSLKFTCGRELFYKPKNLGIAKTFYDLIQALNETDISPKLKTYLILPLENYGWEEKVKCNSCTYPLQIEHYYQRIGMLLCLYYLLQGTDIHHENLIACGEYPIIIDVDAFFHPPHKKVPGEHSQEILVNSVLGTLFLPTFSMGPSKNRGEDISALGKLSDTIETLTWKYLNTDEMILDFESKSSKKQQNQVFLDGKRIEAGDHVEEILKGFQKIYLFIQKKRSFFLGPKGWLHRLADFPTRLILRETYFYSTLLLKLCAPSSILCFEKKRKIQELLQNPKFKMNSESLQILMDVEKEDLRSGDISIFHLFAREKHIYTKEKILLQNYFNECPLDSQIKRIKRMNQEDCRLQIHMIRQAFKAKQPKLEKPTSPLSILEKKLKKEEIFNKIKKIADTILEQAFRSKKNALTWIDSIQAYPSEYRILQQMTDTIYSGNIGIAIFFSALYRLSNEEKWKTEALNALVNIREKIHRANGRELVREYGIGGMNGIGSIIYGLCKIGKILEYPILIQEARKAALFIQREAIQNDRLHDIVSGNAGLLLGLLALWKETHEQAILDRAMLCGECLCSNATKLDDARIGWRNEQGLLMLGFAHGIAGITYALLQLAHIAKSQKFHIYVQQALAYERSLFCQKEKNWPHLGYEHRALSRWCHGAIGIGFGRLASISLFEDPFFHSEIKISMENALEHLCDSDETNLCCGSFGRIAFLHELSTLLPTYRLEKKLNFAVSTLLKHYERKLHETEFHPSFMKGGAGIGYTLLRFLDKENQLPQVLRLEV